MSCKTNWMWWEVKKAKGRKFGSLLQILKQNFSHTKCMLNWSKIIVFRKILTRLMTNHCMVHGFSALCHITYISLLCRQLCVLRWNRFVFGGERVRSDRLLQHGTIHSETAGRWFSTQFFVALLHSSQYLIGWQVKTDCEPPFQIPLTMTTPTCVYTIPLLSWSTWLWLLW